MTWRFALTVVALSYAALDASEAAAQLPRQGPPQGRREMVERIQQRFRDRIARELQLDDGQRELLEEVFPVFAEARAELLPRRRELAREIEAHLEANDVSEDEAMNLIEEVRELRQREAELLLEEEDRLLQVLSPSQVLRLQALRDQFGSQIRRLGGEPRTRGPGGPPRGGRPRDPGPR